MKSGDRIKWVHIHKGIKTIVTCRYGEYIGLVRHTKRYKGSQLAAVVFDGNTRMSRVPFFELVAVGRPHRKEGKYGM
jgi:hypothetical protein